MQGLLLNWPSALTLAPSPLPLLLGTAKTGDCTFGLLGTLGAGILLIAHTSLPASPGLKLGTRRAAAKLQQQLAPLSSNSPLILPPTAIHRFMARKEWLRLHGAPPRRQLATEVWAHLAGGQFFGPAADVGKGQLCLSWRRGGASQVCRSQDLQRSDRRQKGGKKLVVLVRAGTQGGAAVGAAGALHQQHQAVVRQSGWAGRDAINMRRKKQPACPPQSYKKCQHITFSIFHLSLS